MDVTMTNDRQRAIRRLEELYERLPRLQCQGKCAHSCVSRIDMSHIERSRIREAGRDIVAHRSRRDEPCPALTFLGTCSIYAVRPMICRLWGTSVAMPCPHGCQPDGARPLNDIETLDLLLTSLEIGGHPLAEHIDKIREFLSEPQIAGLVTQVIQGDTAAAAALVAAATKQRR
jgi:hypothetical protein